MGKNVREALAGMAGFKPPAGLQKKEKEPIKLGLAELIDGERSNDIVKGRLLWKMEEEEDKEAFERHIQEEAGAVTTKLNLSLFTKIIPYGNYYKKSGPCLITLSPYGDLRISVGAQRLASEEVKKKIHEGKLKAEVYVNKKGNIMVIMPCHGDNGFTFRRKNTSKTLTAKAKQLTGILSVTKLLRFEAAWDPELQAWVGRLT